MSKTPGPVYLLAGGRSWRRQQKDSLLERILAEAAPPRPSIAYIGVASGDNREFLNWLSPLFKQAGAKELHLVPLASARADPEAALAILAGSDLVFISGGGVDIGMKHLERQGTIPFLKRLHASGKPFLGLSAGSIMLARCWLRWADPHDDATAKTFPCLGLAAIFCDTHGESEEWGELKTLMKIIRPDIGYGIPAGAALRAAGPNGALAALGNPVHRLKYQNDQLVRIEDLAPLP